MQTEIKGKIVLLVLVCHIVAVSLLFFSVEPKPLIKKPHKIAIQNIKLSPKQENTIKSQPLPIIEVIEVIKEPLKEEIKPQDIEEKPLVEEKNTTGLFEYMIALKL